MLWILGLGITLFLSSSVFLILITLNNQDKFYQNIYIGNLHLGGLTYQEALNKIQQDKPLQNFVLNIKVNQQNFATSSASLNPSRNYKQLLDESWQFGREKNLFTRINHLVFLTQESKYFYTSYQFDEQKIRQFLNLLKTQTDSAGQAPFATLAITKQANSLKINPGETGYQLDVEANTTALLTQLTTFANQYGNNPIPTFNFNILLNSPQLALTKLETELAQQRATKLVGQQIILKAARKTVKLNDQQLIELLAFPTGYQEEKMQSVLDDLGKLVNRPAQNAIFSFDEKTLVVQEFISDKEGIELDKAKTTALLKQKIQALEDQTNNQEEIFDVVITTSKPEITLAQTNSIGINELIGFGESYYNHSSANRIHNVTLTAQRVNHALVAPGQEFSFLKKLGPVTGETGFKQAYVIRNGKTELDDGGGVCQVSSTLFRALLDAGLKITRRLPHTYRVSYYELNNDPGFDATVYMGDTDLRFINDTDHYVLINTYTDNDNLYMYIEIYGKSDGRTTQITDYQKWDYQAPPPTIYQPDSSLPAGSLKKIESAVPGLKTKFTHIIKNAQGEITSQKEYTSHYKAWPAVYLQGI